MTAALAGCILERMSDRLHTHVSLGFEASCPACDQVAEQLQAGVLVNADELVLAV